MSIDTDVPADRPPGDEAASRRQRVVALGASAEPAPVVAYEAAEESATA